MNLSELQAALRQFAAMPGTHVLLDYENVQPTEDELRAMVPDAGQVWVFHGPQQRQVKQRFASFGAGVTTVPISRTGRNALDFHLAFYMGFIASGNRASAIVVVANDKGYEPVLAHAKTMGFAVRQQRCGCPKPAAAVKANPAAKATAAGKPAAKQAAAKKAAAAKGAAEKAAAKASGKHPAREQAPSKKKAAAKKDTPVAPTIVKATLPGNLALAKKALAKLTSQPALEKIAQAGRADGSALPAQPPASSALVGPSTVSASLLAKIAGNLGKMGDTRPVKLASLRRALKSLLGAQSGDESIEVAIGNLIAAGVVSFDAKNDLSYPAFATRTGAGSSEA